MAHDANDGRSWPALRGSHRLRIGRRSEVGACYFVTVKSAGREPIFLLPAAAGIVVRSIDGYFDHRIRHDEKLEQVAFYCFRNPVHAGLVLDGGDWPFWGCRRTLWSKVLGNAEDLLALEMEKKGWSPPVTAGEG